MVPVSIAVQALPQDDLKRLMDVTAAMLVSIVVGGL
jgi:hypothetical protein